MVNKEEEKEKNPNPFADEEFRAKSFDFGSVEDRRRFEQNLIKFDVPTRHETVMVETTIGSPLIVPPYGIHSGQTGEIRLKELATNGVNYVGFRSPDRLGSDIIWILPESTGERHQFLQHAGNNRLVWGWPYWKKVGHDIYYPYGKVGVNIAPEETFHIKGNVRIEASGDGSVWLDFISLGA